MKWYLIAAGVLLGLLAHWLGNPQSLTVVEQQILEEHPVPHIRVAELMSGIANSEDTLKYLIFDVRQFEEYEVSHLRSAIRIDSEMSGKAFLQQYQEKAVNKTLVFYCSVGKRSAVLVERIIKELTMVKSRSEISVANLQGGIFRWYLSGYPVVNVRGNVKEVHPYNSYWGKLLK